MSLINWKGALQARGTASVRRHLRGARFVFVSAARPSPLASNSLAGRLVLRVLVASDGTKSPHPLAHVIVKGYLCHIIMPAVMEATVFNPAQRYMLELMSRVKAPEQLEEIRQLLSDYFAKKIDEEMDQLWDEGKITPETIEEWGREHMRTPYKRVR